MSAMPLQKVDVVTQVELEEIAALKVALANARELVKLRLESGAAVEPGPMTAELATRRKPSPVKKYREWLVGATSEGSVSRREKLVKRGEYLTLVIK